MSNWSFRQLKHWILSTRDNFICSKGYFFSSIFGHKAGTYYFGQINIFIKTPWTKIFAQYFRFYRQSKDGATILEELDQIQSDRSSVWYVMLGFHKNSIKPYKRGFHEIVFFSILIFLRLWPEINSKPYLKQCNYSSCCNYFRVISKPCPGCRNG